MLTRRRGHAVERTDVFIWFVLLDQLREAALHDAGRPLVHLTLAVVVAPDDALDTLRQTHTNTELSVYTHVGVTGCRFSPRGTKITSRHCSALNSAVKEEADFIIT